MSTRITAVGIKFASLPGTDERSSGLPTRPKATPCTPISTAGSPTATAYHQDATRQRTRERINPRIEEPVRRTVANPARAGPNWATIIDAPPPPYPDATSSHAGQLIA